MGSTAFVVNVVTVGIVADGYHLCAQFVEHFRGNVVACTVGGINHQFEAAQVEVARECGFTELDIAVVGAIDAAGTAEQIGRTGLHFLIQAGFDFQFDFVAQFHAAFGEEFDAIIVVNIVRSGNHHTSRQTQCTSQIGHAGSRQRASENHVNTGGGKTGGKRGFQHIAGNTGVFTDDDGGALIVIVLHQYLAGGIAEFQNKFRGNRKLTHFTAHAVGAEIFFSHQIKTPSLLMLSPHFGFKYQCGCYVF